MTDQLSLEDAIAARDKGIQQAEDHAHQQWLDVAYNAIVTLAQQKDTFTADDLWRIIDWTGATTHEPRAMGAVVKRAVRDGIIEPTGSYVKSARKVNHARPQPVYRGLRRAA